MNSNRILAGVMALAAAASLCSCASPVERRIAKNPEAFAKLSATDQAAVRAGQIREGMEKPAVFLAWGRPGRVAEGKKGGRSFERWTYVEYDSVVHAGGGFGFGYWGRGPFYDVYDPYYYPRPTTVDFVPYDAAFVEFIGGRVHAWARPRR